MNWILGKYGWTVPLLAALLVIGGTVYLDSLIVKELASARREAESIAERRASALSDEIGNALSHRIGALAAAKLPFTSLEDSASQASFMAAVDSVTRNLYGLNAISVINPATGRIIPGPGATLGRRGVGLETDTALSRAYARALSTGKVAASGVLELPVTGRRVVIFEPVVRGDSARLVGVLAAEINPGDVIRAALSTPAADSLVSAEYPYTVYGPGGSQITLQTMSRNRAAIERPIRVADTEWTLRVAYPPVSEGVFQAQRVAVWVAGVVIALALASMLLLLREKIRTQRDEIARRRIAEQDARHSAEEARRRAREARELALQLEAAQRTAQQLSTSLDPDNVVELFLGNVAEALGADVASLYVFEEEGEVVVGRRRIIFRDAGPRVQRLREDDIRQVRAPVALLPAVADAVATGEPYVSMADADSRAGGAGPEAPDVSVAIPLMIAGHMVGVALWEVYEDARSFEPSTIAFAQALAAPAAAALRTAELFSSLESARARASREALRFGTVLDQMADGVVVVDADGNVERYNKAAEEMLGNDIATRPLSEWTSRLSLSGTDARPLTASDFPLLRALRGERVRRANFIVRSSWGGERYLSSSAGPIRSDGGEATGAAMVFRDVTDEHQYAEILRHTNRELRQQAEVLEEVNRQLREATKAKDQFLAVMSHELRTPINAIMGYSDLLDLGVKGHLSSEQRGMVQRVRDTSRHLLGLINEVLDLAKIGAGRVELVMVEIEVARVVDRCVQQVLPLAAAKGLRLTVEGSTRDDGDPITILTDETRLTQVLLNLLSNAVKFTHQGSVTIGYDQVGDMVEIVVRDTGVGIEPDKLDRIFEEFYQIDGGFSRSTTGTGLGLAIARRFTRLMGGEVRVRSEIGAGSEFVVEVPGAHVETGAASRPTSTVAMLSEDEAMIDSVRRALGGESRVSIAAEPPRLAALVRRERPDLVAIDPRVGDHAAWRTLAMLQPDHSLKPIRASILAFSAIDPGLAVPLGPFTILTKPISLESVVDAIRTTLPAHVSAPVLIADDDDDVVRILSEAISAIGIGAEAALNGADLLRRLEGPPPGAIVLDLLMPGADAIRVLARLRARPALRDVPVLLMVARELSGQEMDQISASVAAVGRSEQLCFDPVAGAIAGILGATTATAGLEPA